MKMLMKEVESPFAIDRVRAIKKLDCGPITQSHLYISPPSFGEFISDPFVRRHAIVMTALDHKWPRKNQPAHLRVIEGIAQIKFRHVVFASIKVTIIMPQSHVLPNPFVVICRANRKTVAIEQ